MLWLSQKDHWQIDIIDLDYNGHHSAFDYTRIS